MHRIREWLYISDYPSASSVELTREMGIQAILQLHQPFTLAGIECKYLEIVEGSPLKTQHIEEAATFFREQYALKRRILSSCGAGISRSATFAVIALKEIEGLTLADAYRDVHRHHPKAMPDHIHWQSIAEYYGEPERDFWELWSLVTLEELE